MDRTQPAGYANNASDCDDSNAAIKPGAVELYDGIDNNCDGLTDEGWVTYYQDADGDAYGNPAVSQVATSQPAGYVLDSTDCNDSNVAINPVAIEIVDGIDNNCDGHVDECVLYVPEDYSTIQGAINAVSIGGTVWVSDGVYYESINFNGKAITVRSVNGSDYTTINGGANGRVVTFNTSEGVNSILTGFTITNGLAMGSGGGIYCEDGALPAISNCVITGNTAYTGGGISSVGGASPTIDNCAINNNMAIATTYGTAAGGGVYCADSSPTISNSTITGNLASGGWGGGIYDYSSDAIFGTITIDNCIITGNSAYNGGGLYFHVHNTIPNIIGGDITNNYPNNIVYVP